mmetsp:Transcript_21900/g.40268  ORF Transcript_21900/g.40268 Transcript_21900/m.40268 type:complete len:181 (-) Transcript_21900:95-637(-)
MGAVLPVCYVPVCAQGDRCFTKDMHGMDYINGQQAYLEEVDTCPKGRSYANETDIEEAPRQRGVYSDSAKMLPHVIGGMEACKEIARKRTPFEVVLKREGKHWMTVGLLVSPDDDPTYLLVDDIWKPSLIDEWNQSCERDLKVQPGDRITAVNGNSCGAEQMLELLQALDKGSSVRLRFE